MNAFAQAQLARDHSEPPEYWTDDCNDESEAMEHEARAVDAVAELWTRRYGTIETWRESLEEITKAIDGGETGDITIGDVAEIWADMELTVEDFVRLRADIEAFVVKFDEWRTLAMDKKKYNNRRT